MTTDLIERLREYSGNNGFGHIDYADTMRNAADALEALGREVEGLKDRLESSVHGQNQTFDLCKMLEAERDQARAELAAIRAQEPPSNPAMKITVRDKDWTVGYLSLPVGEHELFTKNYVYNASPAASPDVGALVKALELIKQSSFNACVVAKKALEAYALTQSQASLVPDASPSAKDAGLVAAAKLVIERFEPTKSELIFSKRMALTKLESELSRIGGV